MDVTPPPTQAVRTQVAAQPAAARGPLGTEFRAGFRAGFRIVAIGASAGGLQACTKLLQALPGPTGMAFILVQHLDPGHDSLLVELLGKHTAMAVVQAAGGMVVEPEHLYVIPPGSYLSIRGGALHLSPPDPPHEVRLPFDVLLRSLAAEYGARAACVVLSGTGNDGSVGLQAVKAQGGCVIAQDPDEAEYDGMPRSAIGTGKVDTVAALAGIPGVLAGQGRPAEPCGEGASASPPSFAGVDPISDIINLLRARTRHDFTLYKRGTLERRIGRRMLMASIPAGELGRYLQLLSGDQAELDLLARDLLIHVTGFFRDPDAYAALSRDVIPGLLRTLAPGQPLRIWVAGCSTGEEAYSLVMLFREAITAAGLDVRLQAFASDIDAEAVATARAGLYSAAITSEVSAQRLAQFFAKEDGHGYRVLPDIRAMVVFTAQDLLTDPPFSRLDFVSCRNLLIYLGPEAQARAAALFHFALREGGALWLGSAESLGETDGKFEVISKTARVYRHVGRKRPGDLTFTASAAEGARSTRPGRVEPPSRQSALAELCRRQVEERHAPASVLCNAKHECLYSLGPTDRYLRVAPGHATPDLLAMARGTLRTRLRAALGQAAQGTVRVVVPGGRAMHDGQPVPFNIEVQPLSSDGEALLLVSFVDAPFQPQGGQGRMALRSAQRVAGLERELDLALAQLEDNARTLEAYGEEQRAINEEALSVNEEHQSTNEELLTSKEELQSLNEELTALNSQLQETLERQRTTANDLQNILYSTDVATLFLDRDLNIRFFTPATRALFNVIPGDIGRPLADLHSLATDTALPADARAVLGGLDPVEREIETPGGTWFRRRILPYRTDGNEAQGVVITFNDITRRKQAALALEDAKKQAEAANLAKSRFLAAASHDLRQPLQTLTLLQGLLAKASEGEKARALVHRLDETLGAMSAMLDSLLDLNQIEAGVVQAEVMDYQVGALLDQLRGEFAYAAQAKGLSLRVVPCSATIRTDPRLLEQMVRNLLANALKYTERGRVLLGCRRQGGSLRIEVWDTGIGIPGAELQAVFQEYHQLGNEARERALGLGLGLAIVQRLGGLLGHQIRVRSQAGKGSVFSIEVARAPDSQPAAASRVSEVASAGRITGAILVIEDDPDLRDLLRLLLATEGHLVAVAPDGPEALGLVARGPLRPDLVVADYNLPGGLNGLQAVAALRATLPGTPAIILTGDISARTSRDVAEQGCMRLNKPVRPVELARLIQEILSALSHGGTLPRQAAAAVDGGADGSGDGPANNDATVFVVDDDDGVRATIRAVLVDDGQAVQDYPSSEAFLAAYRPGAGGCLLVDAYLPGMGGIELLQQLRAAGDQLPAIMITGNSDVAMAVHAMKAGASDFIEKPIAAPDLLASIARALEQSQDRTKLLTWRIEAARHIQSLTPRQRQVMDMVLAGHPSKNIAADLGVSQRTVENHRASIMRKSGVRSLPALARLALAAGGKGGDDAPGSRGAPVL